MKFFCLGVVGEGDVKLGYDFFRVVRFTNKKALRQNLPLASLILNKNFFILQGFPCFFYYFILWYLSRYDGIPSPLSNIHPCIAAVSSLLVFFHPVQPHAQLPDIHILFHLSLALSLPSESLHIIHLHSLSKIQAFSSVLLRRAAFHCIFSPESLPDDLIILQKCIF